MAPVKPFEILILPKKTVSGYGSQYNVYKVDGSVIKVKANTVQEALKESGEKEVIKIERAMLSSMNIIDASFFDKASPPPPAANTEQPTA